MIRNIQNLDSQTKYSLLTTTFALALFVIFILNITTAMIHITDLIKQPDFETLSLSFREGYYAINGKKIGVPLLFNLIGIFAVWYLMICHTRKSICQLDVFLDELIIS